MPGHHGPSPIIDDDSGCLGPLKQLWERSGTQRMGHSPSDNRLNILSGDRHYLGQRMIDQ